MQRFIKYILDYLNETADPSHFDKTDLSELSKNGHENQQILIDCDSCIQRLYGGFLRDCQSGGDWRKLNEMWLNLKLFCAGYNFELVLFFNGTYDQSKWTEMQSKEFPKVNKIMNTNEPIGYEDLIELPFLKMQIIFEVIRINQLSTNCARNVYFYQSIKDHKKELAEFCLNKKCDILITEDVEVLSLIGLAENRHPIQLFRGQTFSYSSAHKTVYLDRFDMELVLNKLNMNAKQFALFAFLLENYSSDLLNGFFERQFNLTKHDVSFFLIL